MTSKIFISLISTMLLIPFWSKADVCRPFSVIKEEKADVLKMSYDPKKDSIAFAQMRARMDKIRQHRPTIALVLSGGGARGSSHVGVVQFLEELEIPVDMVLGTSMGGLVGAFYSLGYGADEMNEIIKNIDWDFAMSDNVPRGYISYKESKYKEKFNLSFPFYYKKEDFIKNNAIDESLASDKKYEDLHLGASEKVADNGSLVKTNFLGSLPSGLISGQNVNNIITKFSVGYQDSTNFFNLPIPYLCVATEMVTGKAKLWHEGKLVTALRSTMSIPAFFAPVKTDGMVLVDGGMRNNYPCDLAREMGADIIIGVDLNSGYRGYADINNMLDIVWQGIDMLGRASYEKNANLADVIIRPQLEGYGMLSFDKASIDTIVNRGYQAAVAQKEALKAVKERVGADTTVRYNKKAVNLNKERVYISGVEVEGVNENESRYLMSKINMQAGKKYGLEEIENAVATIYGTKAFDYVTYELQGTKEPYRLLINCKRGPIHQFGFSARFDSEEVVSILANVGFNTHSLQGHAVDLTAKVGLNPYAQVHYYYNSPVGPTINVATSFRWVDKNRFSWGESHYNVAYLKHAEEIYLSNVNWYNFDMNIGLRNDFYRLNSIMADSVFGDYDVDQLTNSYISAVVRAKQDSFDDGYFPTKGMAMNLDYAWVMAGLKRKIEPFHTVQFGIKGALSIKDRFAFLPQFHARFLFGKEIPISHVNAIGGMIPSRYLDQQIPFVGIDNAYTVNNLLLLARMDFRYRLTTNGYLTAMLNGAHSFQTWDQFFSDGNKATNIIGVGLEYAYNSILGPIRANVHWSNISHGPGVFVGVGFDF